MIRRIPAFLIVMTIFLSLMVTGCTPKQDNNYALERLDLEQKIKNMESFKTDSPENYKLQATVQHKTEADAERLIYEIFIRSPKIDMNNLVMSFSLDPHMQPILDTSDIFVTNLLNDAPLDYSPNDETSGVSLFRSFILKRPIIASHILPIYRPIYVKISYTTDGKRTTDYFQVTAEPSEGANEFLAE